VCTEKHESYLILAIARRIVGAIISWGFSIDLNERCLDNLIVSLSIGIDVESIRIVDEYHIVEMCFLGHVVCLNTLLLILVSTKVASFVASAVFRHCWVWVNIGTGSSD
jgi:hypothetical protein